MIEAPSCVGGELLHIPPAPSGNTQGQSATYLFLTADTRVQSSGICSVSTLHGTTIRVKYGVAYNAIVSEYIKIVEITIDTMF